MGGGQKSRLQRLCGSPRLRDLETPKRRRPGSHWQVRVRGPRADGERPGRFFTFSASDLAAEMCKHEGGKQRSLLPPPGLPGASTPRMQAPASAPPWKSVPFKEGKLFSKGNSVILLKQNPQMSEVANRAATHNGEKSLSKQSLISPDPLLGLALLSSLVVLISHCPSFPPWVPRPASLQPQADANGVV